MILIAYEVTEKCSMNVQPRIFQYLNFDKMQGEQFFVLVPLELETGTCTELLSELRGIIRSNGEDIYPTRRQTIWR